MRPPRRPVPPCFLALAAAALLVPPVDASAQEVLRARGLAIRPVAAVDTRIGIVTAGTTPEGEIALVWELDSTVYGPGTARREARDWLARADLERWLAALRGAPARGEVGYQRGLRLDFHIDPAEYPSGDFAVEPCDVSGIATNHVSEERQRAVLAALQRALDAAGSVSAPGARDEGRPYWWHAVACRARPSGPLSGARLDSGRFTVRSRPAASRRSCTRATWWTPPACRSPPRWR